MLRLLKTLLLSTSDFNQIKYEKDSKRRGKAIGMLALKLFVFFILAGYAMITAFGYGIMGASQVIPIITAAVVCMISLFFAFFEVNGYLFAFREYDLIMSLPLKQQEVVTAKFLHMYVRRMPWYVGLAVALEIPFIYFSKPPVIGILLWIMGAFLLPVIPMLLATVIGALLKGISVKFKHKHVVEIVLNLFLVGIIFTWAFSTTQVASEGSLEEMIAQGTSKVENIANLVPMVGWFRDMVTKGSLLAFVLLLGSSLVLYEIIFLVISREYKKINTRLLEGVSLGNYQLGAQKGKSMMAALIFKEWKRFTSSSLYLMNAAMGLIMLLVVSVGSFFMNVDEMMDGMMEQLPAGIPITAQSIYAVIPVLAGMLISMVDTSCMSPSLEGKNNWILASLPVSKKEIANGKILFNVCLQLPAAILAVILLTISTKAGIVYGLCYLLIGVLYCTFSSAIGLWVGVKFIKLDWENEVEVVKQGAATVIYMIPVLILSMGMMVVSLVLSGSLGVLVTLLLLIGLLLILNGLTWLLLNKTVY